jgi:alcohol dehydrogenase class IV
MSMGAIPAGIAATTTPVIEGWSRPLSVVRPNRIEFGPGKAALVGEWAEAQGISRTLVVSDAFNARRVDLLALPGSVTVFAEVKPEPDLPNLEKLLAVARSADAQLVVGFGGGSAMDIAKLAAVMVKETRPFHDLVGVGKALEREVLLAQVPTTAGTGSEAGTRALVTDPESLSKLAVESVHMLADLAVIDSDLTKSVPPAVTAATGIDALAHCVEAYTSRRAHPIIDMYAREGISLVGKYLARAVRDGEDVEARAGLALASLYGGFCLGPVNTTAGHAVSYPLGTRHGIAHGLANAVIFPHTLAFNAPMVREKTADIAGRLGLDLRDLLASAHEFCAGLGVEMKLSNLGVPQADLARMADDAHAIRRLLDHNPRDISARQILDIYEAAF